MTAKHRFLTQAGIDFAEEMTASAMHELKNKLAIINENSGLIQDFSIKARQGGRALDIDRIEAISIKIQQQIQTSDKIIKKVNRFYQEMGTRTKDVNIEQILTFVVRLADRLLDKRGCQIHINAPKSPVIAQFNPFHLQLVLWKILDSISRSAGTNCQVNVSLTSSAERASIIFKVDRGSMTHLDTISETDEIKNLTRFLGVQVRLLEEPNTISVMIGQHNKKNRKY